MTALDEAQPAATAVRCSRWTGRSPSWRCWPARARRGHRDRRRARRAQVHGVPAARHAGGAPAGRAGRRPRQLPPRHRQPAAGRRDHRAARPGHRGATGLPAAGRRHRRDRQHHRAVARPARSTSTRSPGPRRVQSHNWVGQHIPLHATSNGKVLLSELDDAEVKSAVPRAAARTPTGPSPRRAKLRAELAEVREAGYAVAVDELEVGLDRRRRPDPQRARRRRSPR